MLARPMPTSIAPREPIHIYDFAGDCMVVCPKCTGPAEAKVRGSGAKFTCRQCGKVGHEREVKQGAFDPLFGLPLWLQASCCGKTLWAFNRRHLAFLREYVAATDRRRPRVEAGGTRNALLSSRLPRWMILARNREEVLRGLRRLDKRLLEAG